MSTGYHGTKTWTPPQPPAGHKPHTQLRIVGGSCHGSYGYWATHAGWINVAPGSRASYSLRDYRYLTDDTHQILAHESLSDEAAWLVYLGMT